MWCVLLALYGHKLSFMTTMITTDFHKVLGMVNKNVVLWVAKQNFKTLIVTMRCATEICTWCCCSSADGAAPHESVNKQADPCVEQHNLLGK